MPFTDNVPAVGCSRSAIVRKNVVLPQPEGPMKLTNSPLLMVSDTSFNACTGPSLVVNVSDRFDAEITGDDVAPTIESARQQGDDATARLAKIEAQLDAVTGECQAVKINLGLAPATAVCAAVRQRRYPRHPC